jgi:hypothetical protein
MDEAWMEEMMHGNMEEGIYEDENKYVDYTMGSKDPNQLPNPPREINIPDLESGGELPQSPTGGEYGGEFGNLEEDTYEEGMYGEGIYEEDIDEMYTFEEGDSIGEMYIDED